MYPGGMKGPACGLSQQPAEAGGSPGLEAQEAAASSPDNDGTGRHRQTARARQARREGVATERTSGGTPSSVEPAPTWWIWAGQQRAPTWTYEGGDFVEALHVEREGPGNACGVPVARLQGKSWAPPPSTGAW